MSCFDIELQGLLARLIITSRNNRAECVLTDSLISQISKQVRFSVIVESKLDVSVPQSSYHTLFIINQFFYAVV